MSERPWLGALGLRGRIVGVVLVTAVATLVIAAVTLLGPLEAVLKNASKSTLQHELGRNSSVTAPFRKLDPSLVLDAAIPWRLASPSQQRTERTLWAAGISERRDIQNEETILASRIPATDVTIVWGNPPRPLVANPGSETADDDSYHDAAQVLRLGHEHAVYSIGSINGTDYVEAALPFTSAATGPKIHYILAIRKKVDEIPGAVHAVAQAFLIAALAALGLTLLFGIPLSGRIVRRLRRLRQAALRLAQEGPAGEVEVPVDRARDEVGDLARTFAMMQQQLLHQEEARRAFVATASHELRTPLATLDGMLEMLDEDLQSGTPDLDEAQELIVRARAQSRRLGRLAADLLDLSRMDAQVELRSEPVELGELSRAVLAEFELGTGERDISTSLDDHSGPVWALGDPGSVARILRILVDNAVRFSPPGGEVSVELQNGRPASLSVCDQGPGVRPDERELIFERFMRGTGTAGPAGFGLGLAIGRELAERMGGALVLEEQDCPGARFTLRLPVAQAPDIEPIAVG